MPARSIKPIIDGVDSTPSPPMCLTTSLSSTAVTISALSPGFKRSVGITLSRVELLDAGGELLRGAYHAPGGSRHLNACAAVTARRRPLAPRRTSTALLRHAGAVAHPPASFRRRASRQNPFPNPSPAAGIQRYRRR